MLNVDTVLNQCAKFHNFLPYGSIGWLNTLQKNIFFLSIYVLFSSINIKKFLNQDAFTWQDILSCLLKILFKFLLKTSKNICQCVEKNHLNSKAKQDYFSYPIGRYLYLFYIYFTFMHFSRRFYPKRLTVHSGYTCFITCFKQKWTKFG